MTTTQLDSLVTLLRSRPAPELFLRPATILIPPHPRSRTPPSRFAPLPRKLPWTRLLPRLGPISRKPAAPSRLDASPITVLSNAGQLLYNAATGQWAPVLASARRLFTDPKLMGTLLAGFAVSAALAYYVDHRRSLIFSRYWHDARQDLRTALKSARSTLLSGRAQ